MGKSNLLLQIAVQMNIICGSISHLGMCGTFIPLPAKYIPFSQQGVESVKCQKAKINWRGREEQKGRLCLV